MLTSTALTLATALAGAAAGRAIYDLLRYDRVRLLAWGALAAAALIGLATPVGAQTATGEPEAITCQQDADRVVNVNTATAEQLELLPSIGPAKADDLVYAREIGTTFETLSDLEAVHGFGPKTLERICPYVVFEGETTLAEPISSGKKTTGRKIRRPTEED